MSMLIGTCGAYFGGSVLAPMLGVARLLDRVDQRFRRALSIESGSDS